MFRISYAIMWFGFILASLSVFGGCTVEYPQQVRYIRVPDEPDDPNNPGNPPGDDDPNPPDDPGNPPDDPNPPDRTMLFFDDGSCEPANLGYRVLRPDVGVARIDQGPTRRTLVHEGKSGLGLNRRIRTTAAGLHVGVRVQLTGEYLNPSMDSFADDYPLATFEIAFLDAQDRYLGTYFFYARPRHPREDAPPPYRVPPPETLFSRRQVGARVANGSWLIGDIDIENIIRTKFDLGDVTAGNVGAIEIIFSCQDVWGKGDECREVITIDEVTVYRE